MEITAACNHDCLHCYNVWKNRQSYPVGSLETDAMLELLSKVLDETGADGVTLSGGEPLLHPDLFEIVDFLTRRGTRLNLISNGSLLTPEAIRRLSGRVELFELPLLSSERELHDRLSGVTGAFDRVTSAVAELKLAGERVVLVFVATAWNLPTFGETLEVALALGADGVMFNRFNPGGRGAENIDRLQASPEKLRCALEFAEEFVNRHGLPVSCAIPIPPCLLDTSGFGRLSFGFCAAGTDRAYYTVDPLGNLRPCNHSPTILGNLQGSSFAELVAGGRMRDFAAARPKFCSGCRLERRCLGGCKAAAEACGGSIWSADPFLAAHGRQARIPR